MILKALTPRKTLNKAFLKVRPTCLDIEFFKTNLIQLLERIDEGETEEFHKNLVSDFLKKTYYDPKYFINTKGRNDLVIHNNSEANSSVSVIIETKKLTNKAEMITRSNLNAKAFHELTARTNYEKKLEIKYLIATNIYEWCIFDGLLFERLFAQNKELVSKFLDFEAGRLADTKTDFFYKQVAEPFMVQLEGEIECTYFDFPDHEEPLRSLDKEDDALLIDLFKILSLEHPRKKILMLTPLFGKEK